MVHERKPFVLWLLIMVIRRAAEPFLLYTAKRVGMCFLKKFVENFVNIVNTVNAVVHDQQNKEISNSPLVYKWFTDLHLGGQNLLYRKKLENKNRS